MGCRLSLGLLGGTMWRAIRLGFGDMVKKGDVILGQSATGGEPTVGMLAELLLLRQGTSRIPKQPNDGRITNTYYKTVDYWVARKEDENEFGKVIP